ncbi:hypothetical protein FHL15_010610 [Xylaria flabelliformis]|uniref:Uncharacterized protein n=1 Tax=Xylaria flabelliformis TaxID=2512241 RepID=A0A553HKL9_9PEZI|nr:hypothetical protein FHL15_010610 [Xylaria flabelliformis]
MEEIGHESDFLMDGAKPTDSSEDEMPNRALVDLINQEIILREEEECDVEEYIENVEGDSETEALSHLLLSQGFYKAIVWMTIPINSYSLDSVPLSINHGEIRYIKPPSHSVCAHDDPTVIKNAHNYNRTDTAHIKQRPLKLIKRKSHRRAEPSKLVNLIDKQPPKRPVLWVLLLLLLVVVVAIVYCRETREGL